MKNNKVNICLVIITIIIMSLLVLMYIGYLDNIDHYITLYMARNRPDHITKIMVLISEFCSLGMVILIALGGFISLKNKTNRILIVVNTLGVWIVNFLLKGLYSRSRPIVFMLIPETGHSFPSAHAMISMSMYGYVAIMSYKNIQNKILKYLIPIVLLILVMLIGCSRIYLGVHYFFDVLSGYLISVIILIIEYKYILKEEVKQNGKSLRSKKS